MTADGLPTVAELEIRLAWIDENEAKHKAAGASFDDMRRTICALVRLARGDESLEVHARQWVNVTLPGEVSDDT